MCSFRDTLSRQTFWIVLLLVVGCAGSAPSEQVIEQPTRQLPADTPDDVSESETSEQVPSTKTLPGIGELCPAAECVDEAICIGGVCLGKCDRAVDGCNDLSSQCAIDEVCLPATSFSDACFPAAARTGEACGGQDGAICRAGNLCVLDDPYSDQAHCLKLCKYSCPAVQCVETNNGCNVCLPM